MPSPNDIHSMFSPTALAFTNVTAPEPTQNSVRVLSITAMQVAWATDFEDKNKLHTNSKNPSNLDFIWVRFMFYSRERN